MSGAGKLVLAVAGAVIGGMVGQPQIGWMIGSFIGGALFKEPDQHLVGPMLSDLRVTGTEYGAMIPYVIGHPRIAGQIWYASSRRPIPHTTVSSGGKGDSPTTSQTTYTYEVDLLIGLADCEIGGITRIWRDGKLIYTALATSSDAALAASAASEHWTTLTVYTGTETQLPDPDYEAAIGAANATAYRGRAYVFIKSLQLGANGAIPNLTFELGDGNIVVDEDVLLMVDVEVEDTYDDHSFYENTVTPTGSPAIDTVENTVAIESGKYLVYEDPIYTASTGPLTVEFFMSAENRIAGWNHTFFFFTRADIIDAL